MCCISCFIPFTNFYNFCGSLLAVVQRANIFVTHQNEAQRLAILQGSSEKMRSKFEAFWTVKVQLLDTKKKCVLPSTLDGSYHDATCIFHTLGAIRDSLGVFHVGGWVQDEWHRVQIRTSSDILKAQTPFSPIYHQILPTTMQQILTTVEISKTFWMILESWHQALYTKAPCCSALLSYKRHLQLRQQQVVPTHRYANQTDLAPAKIMKIKEVRGEFQHRIAKI